MCANYTSGKTAAYLIHIGEGIDQAARDEFAKLGTLTTTSGCLYAPQTTITHGTSFTATEFATMKTKDMKLTWSPASNVALYGATTNIPLALDNGIIVSLAPDWSMGGSQNMLDELRFAKKLSDTQLGGSSQGAGHLHDGHEERRDRARPERRASARSRRACSPTSSS